MPAADAAVKADDMADALERLRVQTPLVHCLTNVVVAGFTANALLAAGAAPAMADAVEDADVLARAAGGVLVNIGTVTAASADGMRAAVVAVGDAGGRWVLDPVAAGALPWRAALAAELTELYPPAVVRGNASEVLALTGELGGRGVDASAGPDDAAAAATAIAGRFGATVAVSGAVDLITDGERTVRVENGHPLMTKVTGVGCVLGALAAGFLAVVDDPLLATVTATVFLTLAAEDAVARADKPGSFAVGLIDELATVDGDRIRTGARLR
ncbi:hydroxyethylthiazole kinase [Actinopolymorpha sp. B9G3]|uniref:hydroxyethylthiazole kinase n=1 Tax=Actinopolymorpha sp. B9G3 TaxID=3158970 RepID=UPI0032D9557E